MNRRRFIRSTTAGLLISAHKLRALNHQPGSVHIAANLIQKQVDAGILEAATFYVRRGVEVEMKSFGLAESEHAIFLLASISKPMSATGLMVLSDAGELHLSDKVMKFIPEFSEGDRKNITIQQLLTHTSGLPDQLPQNSALRKRHAPLSEFVKEAIRTPLLFKPGTHYSYQSMGILLAAEVAQRITQTPFPEFLRDHVFLPLGMKRTALDLGPFQLSDTVRSQTEFAAPESGSGSEKAKDWDWNSSYWRNLGAPWGGAHGTAPDVARFLESFLNPKGQVIREETARNMIRNHNGDLTPRGLGFDLRPGRYGQNCSNKTFGHGGSTGTLAWADPESERVCVILTSLPARKSGDLILKPVSDIVSS